MKPDSLPDYTPAPVLLIGAGRMGSALIAGWRKAAAFDLNRLMVRAPHPNEACAEAARAGATINPEDAAVATARTVVLCVKPQRWREVAPAYAATLAREAVVVSVLVGTRAADIAQGFGGRRVARVLPTTAVASASGVTSLYAPDPAARAAARALFEPISEVVELAEEPLMDAAGAVSASGAAYVYAFARALAEAGAAAGLPAQASATLARATVASAAAFMAQSEADPAELIAQVASPGGTTEAALAVLDPALRQAMIAAVAAAVRRAEELAG
jgi:pyrroline-5-carboxylate reductase